jgi:hypothetical protein
MLISRGEEMKKWISMNLPDGRSQSCQWPVRVAFPLGPLTMAALMAAISSVVTSSYHSFRSCLINSSTLLFKMSTFLNGRLHSPFAFSYNALGKSICSMALSISVSFDLTVPLILWWGSMVTPAGTPDFGAIFLPVPALTCCILGSL